MATKARVFITGAEAKAALPVAESLHRRGLEVHAGSQNAMATTFFSRYVSRRFRYPSPATQPEAFVQRLLELTRRYGYDAIIPVGEDATEAVARAQQTFLPHTRLVLPPYETFAQGRDKALTLRAAHACSVPIPVTFWPEDTPVDAIARAAPFPVLIKPTISNGARGIVKVDAPEDLATRYAQVSGEYGSCIIQEWIPGGGEQYKADLLVDAKGSVLAEVVYHKLRYYPVQGGSATMVEAVEHREILSNAARVLGQLGWYGFADFDFIVDPRDQVAKLIEINPRFPESMRITEAVGIDFAGMLYDMAMGQPVTPVQGYQTGVFARFLPGDLLWFASSSTRLKAEPSFFRFLDGDTHFYVVSARDPGPIVGYLLETLGTTFRWSRFKHRFLRGF